MYSPPFYDEEGKYHDHDPNSSSTSYSCSNGHTWAESSRSSCWCGWPNDTKAPSSAAVVPENDASDILITSTTDKTNA